VILGHLCNVGEQPPCLQHRVASESVHWRLDAWRHMSGLLGKSSQKMRESELGRRWGNEKEKNTFKEKG